MHRDLKPANVLLMGSRVVITDFGLASLAGDATLTGSGMLLGTPAFMAPEQAHGLPVTPAWDLWSPGATLYAAVEGGPPYTGSNVMAVLAALPSQEPAPPAHAGALAPVLAGLLRRDPAERLDAEQAALALRGITTQPIPPANAAVPDLRPRPSSPGTTRRYLDDGTADGDQVTASPVAGRTTTWAVPDTGGRPTRRRILLTGLALAVFSVPVAIVLTGGGPAPLAGLMGYTSPVASVAFSPDGKTLATGSINRGRLWDVASRKTIAVLNDGPNGFCDLVIFSPDGTTLATSSLSDRVQLWDATGSNVIGTLTGHSHVITAVAFSPDGRTIATTSHDNTVRLWDATTRGNTATFSTAGLPISLAFSPDEDTIAVGLRSGTVELWPAHQPGRTPVPADPSRHRTQRSPAINPGPT
ncbi:hypothetical protein Acor_41950 [Acrocarpospora corrugata]|uniref:Protein kinase domain-containing protein n=1 Tax=Acrocarpospora corrugata TaxID=35763 RepID=A0A5M3W1L6_9ACTN|nr:hypothetical protein Acor_41950 [Acrocarpospora corrugata]